MFYYHSKYNKPHKYCITILVKMKKLSKIDESTWGSMLDRGAGGVIKKEDGKLVHTCLDVDIIIKDQKCDYNEIIKDILNDDVVDGFYQGVVILNRQVKQYSPEEMTNIRKFEAPYAYLIYDGKYGTSLVAEFWTYSEIKDFDRTDDFIERVSEEDYISICKGIATKLKEVGGDIAQLPRRHPTISRIKDRNFNDEYVFKLIDESDIAWWGNYPDPEGRSLADFETDIFTEYPELVGVDFFTWTFYDGYNIGIPINYDTLVNFNKYKEFTKKWFKIDEEAE